MHNGLQHLAFNAKRVDAAVLLVKAIAEGIAAATAAGLAAAVTVAAATAAAATAAAALAAAATASRAARRTPPCRTRRSGRRPASG